jgi:hypothetical protein
MWWNVSAVMMTVLPFAFRSCMVWLAFIATHGCHTHPVALTIDDSWFEGEKISGHLGGTMKLSEAISLGAMLSPQAFGFLEDAQGRRCAPGGSKGCNWRLYELYGMEMGVPWG